MQFNIHCAPTSIMPIDIDGLSLEELLELDYFLTYPERIRERPSLQMFEQWIFSQVNTD